MSLTECAWEGGILLYWIATAAHFMARVCVGAGAGAIQVTIQSHHQTPGEVIRYEIWVFFIATLTYWW